LGEGLGWICAQERLLGFALGSVSMGGFVLHQRRAIYRSLADADAAAAPSPFSSYQVCVCFVPMHFAVACNYGIFCFPHTVDDVMLYSVVSVREPLIRIAMCI
ncbi:Os10g0481400, partial [Oryza sativa Japonica Group]